jgi:hypothetical protein
MPEPGAAEDVGEDLRHREALEDAAVGAQPQARHRRHEGDPVLAARPPGVDVGEAADHAVDHAWLGQLPLDVDRQRGRAPHEVARCEVVVFADEGDLDLEGLRDRLVAGEADDAQGVIESVDREGVHGLWGSLALGSPIRRDVSRRRAAKLRGGPRGIQQIRRRSEARRRSRRIAARGGGARHGRGA